MRSQQQTLIGTLIPSQISAVEQTMWSREIFLRLPEYGPFGPPACGGGAELVHQPLPVDRQQHLTFVVVPEERNNTVLVVEYIN